MTRVQSLSEVAFDRLPPGRHHLDRAEVDASQRSRLLRAALDIVAEKGAEAITIADIVGRAGVARRTFYRHFASKDAVLLNCLEIGLGEILAVLADAERGLARSDWPGRVRAMMRGYVLAMAERPGLARLAHIEMVRGGPTMVERRALLLAFFARRNRELYRRARLDDPSLPVLPPELFAVLVAGVDELIRDFLRAHPAARLRELADPVGAVALGILGGIE